VTYDVDVSHCLMNSKHVIKTKLCYVFAYEERKTLSLFAADVIRIGKKPS
jgi:hypothetical protein